MAMNTSPVAIGPYFDYSARSKFLNEKLRAFGTLTAESVRDGDYDRARHWAEKHGAFQAQLDRLSAWYDRTDHEAPERWIGWDVQKGYESLTDTRQG